MTREAPGLITVFQDPGNLRDGDLSLRLERRIPADLSRGRVPAYLFALCFGPGQVHAGSISLRLGETEYLTRYAGQVGYSVDRPYRGHRLAARAVVLILGLARRHRFGTLWITTNPDNIASRKTCERAGGVLVETVEVPPGTELYERGDRRKCRYRFDL